MEDKMNTSTTSSPIPSGPNSHFLLGALPEYSRNPLEFMSMCARTYGDVVYLTGLIPSYLLNHPDFIKEMLVTQHHHLIKSQLGKITKPLLENGLLLSEGDFWKQQRHLIQPSLITVSLELFIAVCSCVYLPLKVVSKKGNGLKPHRALNSFKIMTVPASLLLNWDGAPYHYNF
jgi:Cytochrome P450